MNFIFQDIKMKKQLKLKGQIIDSLVLSKLLDEISDLGIECYATDIKVGKRREDNSEATFVIETDDSKKMTEAIKLAKEQGAYDN